MEQHTATPTPPTPSSSPSPGLNASLQPPPPSSTSDLLFEILGPKQSPLALPIAAVYLLIFLPGLSGNLLTCAVIARHRRMRTPTNLYLLSLAACDLLLLLVAMPLEVHDLWRNCPFPFGDAGCHLKTFLFETVCFASVLSVTALSGERYVAVVHPLRTRHLSTNRHARRVLGGVWLASMACAVPNALLHGVFRLPGRAEESAVCTVLRPLWLYKLLIQVTTVCFYLVPMAVISALYLAMAVHLGRQRSPPGHLGKSRGPGARPQVTKMLAVVVAVFGLCWAPFHAERLLWSSVSQWTDAMHGVYQWVHILSGVLFYLSSAVNPLIYSLLSTRFREGFRQLVCWRTEDAAAAAAAAARHSPPLPPSLLGPGGAAGPQGGGAPEPDLRPLPGAVPDAGLPLRCGGADCVTSAC
ncbi:unnamed protein product [Arctogadus glacialis]